MRQRVSSRASSVPSIQASLSKCSNYAVSGTPPPEFGKALESKATLSLNWEEMYKTRLELDRRWVSGEPKMLKMSGHEDRYVYHSDYLSSLSFIHINARLQCVLS